MRVHWNYHAGRVSHEHKVFAVYIHRVWSWWLLVFKDIEGGNVPTVPTKTMVSVFLPWANNSRQTFLIFVSRCGRESLEKDSSLLLRVSSGV